MLRDVENLMLNTLCDIIVEETGIPSGNIYLKRPSSEFVVQLNGPNVIDPNDDNYPAISIEYFKDAKFEYNNYGESVVVNHIDNTSTIYTPLAEVKLTLGISLYTASRGDQRDYGTKLYICLLKHKFINYNNDIIKDEYFTVDVMSQKDIPEVMPFRKIVIIKTQGRILEETVADTVLEIVANADNISVNNVEEPSGRMLSITPSGTIWG